MTTRLRDGLIDLASEAPQVAGAPPTLVRRARRRAVLTAGGAALIVLFLVGAAVGIALQERAGQTPEGLVGRDPFAELRGKLMVSTGDRSDPIETVDPTTGRLGSTSLLPRRWSPIGWSRDGEHLLARIWSRNGTMDLGIVNADGSTQRLTYDGWEWGSFSPDGSSVVVDGTRGLAIVTLATGATRRLITPGPGENVFGAAWSPDGRSIAFGEWRGSTLTVRSIGQDGTGLRLLAQLPSRRYADHGPLEWSPDGSRLALSVAASDREGAIFVMDANGAHLERVTAWRDNAFWSTWSPDGTQIAFVSGPLTASELTVMDADGSHRRSIGPGGWSPVWTSPTSSKR